MSGQRIGDLVRDAITGKGCGVALAQATGGQLVMLVGWGHGPHMRDAVNLLLREFAASRALTCRPAG